MPFINVKFSLGLCVLQGTLFGSEIGNCLDVPNSPNCEQNNGSCVCNTTMANCGVTLGGTTITTTTSSQTTTMVMTTTSNRVHSTSLMNMITYTTSIASTFWSTTNLEMTSSSVDAVSMTSRTTMTMDNTDTTRAPTNSVDVVSSIVGSFSSIPIGVIVGVGVSGGVLMMLAIIVVLVCYCVVRRHRGNMSDKNDIALPDLPAVSSSNYGALSNVENTSGTDYAGANILSSVHTSADPTTLRNNEYSSSGLVHAENGNYNLAPVLDDDAVE